MERNGSDCTVGVAGGKLLLFGEHAAVYGYPAVGTALPLYTRVRFCDQAGRPLRGLGGQRIGALDLHALEPADRPAVRAVMERLFALTKICDERKAEPARISLEISSTVPRSLGLGSSAALCAAIASAACPRATPLQRWTVANELERQFHGTPSGVDTGISTLGSARAFWFNAEGIPEEVEITLPPGYVLAGAIPRHSSTKALIGELRTRIATQGAEPRNALAALGELSAAAAASLAARSPERNGPQRGREQLTIETLGARADRAHAILRRLQLSTTLLDDVLDLGRRLGATGGKLSGGGGGGAFFLLFSQQSAAEHARQTIGGFLREQLGARVSDTLPLLVFHTAQTSQPRTSEHTSSPGTDTEHLQV